MLPDDAPDLMSESIAEDNLRPALAALMITTAQNFRKILVGGMAQPLCQ
jgi:hypothetical protein